MATASAMVILRSVLPVIAVRAIPWQVIVPGRLNAATIVDTGPKVGGRHGSLRGELVGVEGVPTRDLQGRRP